MTRTITIPDLEKLIAKHGMKTFFRDLIRYLTEDLVRWKSFHKMPRLAAYFPNGVIELMPIWDDRHFSFKYVNGHPENPKSGHLNVVAIGMFSEGSSGYPLMLSEMTVLTAIRTAAASALATDLMANPNLEVFTIIGTGAQSEFQTLAHQIVRPIHTVQYFDLDPHAMERFRKNMEGTGLHLKACKSVEEAVHGSSLITISTAAKGHVEVLPDALVKPGMHINGIGGDSPGKTELALATVKRSRIFVEYLPQTEHEGEIQRLTPEERKKLVLGEIWELAAKLKKGRESPKDITLYDSVGFAIWDFSILRLVHDLSKKYQIGISIPLIPELKDPKNLVSLLGGHHKS